MKQKTFINRCGLLGVVVLSIASLVLIIIGGGKDKQNRSYGVWAAIALSMMMMVGAIGTAAAPAAYFGVVERFSVFAAVGFNAVLGIKLFRGIE